MRLNLASTSSHFTRQADLLALKKKKTKTLLPVHSVLCNINPTFDTKHKQASHHVTSFGIFKKK